MSGLFGSNKGQEESLRLQREAMEMQRQQFAAQQERLDEQDKKMEDEERRIQKKESSTLMARYRRNRGRRSLVSGLETGTEPQELGTTLGTQGSVRTV